jgi:hypothetical protein
MKLDWKNVTACVRTAKKMVCHEYMRIEFATKEEFCFVIFLLSHVADLISRLFRTLWHDKILWIFVEICTPRNTHHIENSRHWNTSNHSRGDQGILLTCIYGLFCFDLILFIWFCLFICLFVCLFLLVCLFVYLFIYFIYLFIYLFSSKFSLNSSWI